MNEELVQEGPATADTIVQDNQPQEQAPQPEQQAVPVSKSKEANMRELRLAAERAQQERDALAQRLAQYENAASANIQQPQAEDELYIPEDDGIPDNKTVSKMNKSLRKDMADMRKQQQAILDQTKALNGEARFKAENPDWEQVMSLDNIKTLSVAYPEMAKVINSTADVYEKAKCAYTTIKKFGIHDENPYEADKQRAVANSTKPRPLTSISPQQGESPMSRANAFDNGLTKDIRDQLLKEMNEARKGY